MLSDKPDIKEGQFMPRVFVSPLDGKKHEVSFVGQDKSRECKSFILQDFGEKKKEE